MNRELIKRSGAEFLVIVVGVLTALAVDDLRQGHADREYERYVVSRLTEEAAADLEQLDMAKERAEARLWIVYRLLAALGDGDAMANLDTLPEPGDERAWSNPVSGLLRWTTEYDRSDATYRELLATGGLQVLHDPNLRRAVSEYYFSSAAQAEGEQRMGRPAQELLEESLASIGIAPDDRISLEQLVLRVGGFDLAVDLRRVRSGIRGQITRYKWLRPRLTDFRMALDSAVARD